MRAMISVNFVLISDLRSVAELLQVLWKSVHSGKAFNSGCELLTDCAAAF